MVIETKVKWIMLSDGQKNIERRLQTIFEGHASEIEWQTTHKQSNERKIYLEQIPAVLVELQKLTGMPLDTLLSAGVDIAATNPIHLHNILCILRDFYRWQALHLANEQEEGK